MCASDLFRDVAENTWYHEAWTTWCARAYMDGMGGASWRERDHDPWPDGDDSVPIAGKPSVEGLENPFRDVAEG
ncbi:MAG: hypothetical protein ACLSHU_01995 [Oscillospiraceae bacterium]